MAVCRGAYIIFLLYFFPTVLVAQAIDNTVSFRNIHSDHYTRIYYENDFFTGTDRDYTQGIYVEFVRPALKKFLLSKLLWHPRNSIMQYGLGLEDDGYTPNFLDRPAIQYGDRPYAGLLFLKTFLTAINTTRKERISVLLSTGLIGPDAGGEGMQKAIHHWINYTQPVGWHNQIRNDAVLNYQVNYEKELFADGHPLLRDHFLLAAYSSARLGTLSDKATAGLTFMAGNFYSPFKDTQWIQAGKLQWYFYGQSLGNVVGYDATLQGGLFNHSGPYTISGSAVDRFTFQNKFGFVVILKKLYLEYFQTTLTPEFKTSVFHRTGGIQIGFGF